jgi:hypothetical protein
MIKFFRKIRQQLFANNNLKIPASPAGRYFLYALGEIMLVVVGILLALQINTWNNELQDRTLERSGLENLRTDLTIQKEIIQEQIENEALILTYIDTCSFYFTSTLSTESLYQLLINLASRQTFVSNKASFENMGSTGGFVLIRNLELQNAIVRYYKQLDYTEAVVNNNNLFLIDNQFGSFVFNNDLKFRLSKNGLMDTDYELNPEKLFTLKSQLEGRRKASQSIQSICELQLEATEKLIQLINDELEA